LSNTQAICIRLAEVLSVEYDGVLANYYADPSVHIRYHSDPDQGTVWAFDSAVVSLGATRMFAFRETRNPSRRYVFPVGGGDVLHMFADCQERFQHSVLKEQKPKSKDPVHTAGDGRESAGVRGREVGGVAQASPSTNFTPLASLQPSSSARISLVFKKSLTPSGAP
jgi:hypothetical protein